LSHLTVLVEIAALTCSLTLRWTTTRTTSVVADTDVADLCAGRLWAESAGASLWTRLFNVAVDGHSVLEKDADLWCWLLHLA